jgi:spore maturation protein CgeB
MQNLNLEKGGGIFNTIKNFIKSNFITKSVYAKLQCFVVVTQYKIIKVIYRIKKRKKISNTMKEKAISAKPKILYFGGDELQDKSGFLQALGLYSELTYFTKEDGSYGSYNYGLLNRSENIAKNKNRLFQLLHEMEAIPDILLMQTWEWRIGLDTLKDIKQKYPNIIIANIAMDDRHSYWIYGMNKFGSAGLIPQLDYVFTTSSEAVEWYQKEGCRAFFYPLASDEIIFKPLNIEKIYDIGFVGAKYGIREAIVNSLLQKDINVKAYGSGWESGRLPINDTNKFYNQCKIVLGISTILGCNNFVSMKLRDFDVPMSGSVYITNYNEDTAKIFQDNTEACYYNNIDDCIEKVLNLLSDENKLEEIRQNTLVKALDNTYEKRVKELLNTLGCTR